jgi:iron complex outermembrane receptor protein
MMTKARYPATAGACSIALLLSPTPAAAQDQSSPAPATLPAASKPAASAGGDAAAEIIVTARKVGENLQRTPVAVSAISGELLERQSLVQLEDLSNVVPNLQLTTSSASGTGALVYIRGVGSNSSSLYADSPVAVYVDGALLPHGAALSFDLPDLDHIEVLRGPQGTLFGRNTTGGAVNLFTSQPTEQASAKLMASYGTDNDINANAVLNSGEIAPGLRLKATYAHDQIDGFVNSPGVSKSESPGFRKTDAASGEIRWQPSSTFTATYRGDYGTVKQRYYAQFLEMSPLSTAYYGNSPNLGGAPLLVSPKYIGTEYLDPRLPPNHVTTYGHALTLDYDPSAAINIKSITAYRHFTQHLYPQFTGSAGLLGTVLNPANPANPVETVGPFINIGQPGRQSQWSEELQLSGKTGDFTYVIGGYYFSESIDDSLPSDITFILSPTSALQLHKRRTYHIDTQSYAGFGQLSYRPGALDDRLEVTGGVRYTSDNKTLHEVDTSSSAPTFLSQDLRNHWSDLSGAGSVSFQWTPLFMTYARVSNGYKAGGYNPGSLQPAYNPEHAVSYEAGFKSELLGRHVRFNVDLFDTEYNDLQVSQFNGVTGASEIINAAKARYRGGEAELHATFGRIAIDGSFGYVDPKFLHYFNVNASGAMVDVANQAKVPGVSKYTANIGGSYTFPETGIGKPSLRLDYAYRSSQYSYTLLSLVAYAQFFPIQALHELNGSIKLADIPLAVHGQYSIEVFGRNLLDNIRRIGVTDFGPSLGVVSGYYDRGRIVGVRLRAGL